MVDLTRDSFLILLRLRFLNEELIAVDGVLARVLAGRRVGRFQELPVKITDCCSTNCIESLNTLRWY